jgi:cyclase
VFHKRVIPCLLLHKGGLYKTVRFKDPTYIGDPINAVRIFNDKEVDELIFLDIDASVQNRGPDYKMVEDIASECFMPLCYGGGIKNINQMKTLFSLGVEKVTLSSAAVENPLIVREAATVFGSQSVAVTVDVLKKTLGAYQVVTHNAKKKSQFKVEEFVVLMEKMGAGEIIINSVNNDGVMKGYDMELLRTVTQRVTMPVVAMGGAGQPDDFSKAVKGAGVSALAAGSLFVYHGPLKGVLINYPSANVLRTIL